MGLIRWFCSIPLVSKFLKFAVVGASGMVVDYGFLIVFKELLKFPEWASIAFAFIIAASSNYLFNRFWTFKSHNKRVGKEYVNFIIVSVVGLLITEIVMFLFGEYKWTQHVIGDGFADNVYFYINKFIAIVITTLWNFFGNLFITFRQRKEEEPAGAKTPDSGIEAASASSDGKVATVEPSSAVEPHQEDKE